MQSFFIFDPDWYRKGEVRRITAHYFWTLRSVLKTHPHLRRLIKQCMHCQILIITHPRNGSRNDLRCPFGCRQAHRKISSAKRSKEYYRTKEGKFKKKLLNGRRKSPKNIKQENDHSDACSIDRTTLYHIQLVTGMIEGRAIAFADILSMVRDLLRQHSIDMQKKPVYKCPRRQKPPP